MVIFHLFYTTDFAQPFVYNLRWLYFGPYAYAYQKKKLQNILGG